MADAHEYRVEIEWIGNRGTGTSGYRDYGRQLVVRAEGKAHEILASSDKPFHGDAERWNPEDLMVTALAQCHMLSYLHMAMRAGVIVTAYQDEATGSLAQDGMGGRFTEVVLHPVVTVSDATMVDAAIAAHEDAHEYCFIANSVNFPVRFEPTILVAQ
jgi:organic hydroperoxide reductase OsmC/OhrA